MILSPPVVPIFESPSAGKEARSGFYRWAEHIESRPVATEGWLLLDRTSILKLNLWPLGKHDETLLKHSNNRSEYGKKCRKAQFRKPTCSGCLISGCLVSATRRYMHS